MNDSRKSGNRYDWEPWFGITFYWGQGKKSKLNGVEITKGKWKVS